MNKKKYTSDYHNIPDDWQIIKLEKTILDILPGYAFNSNKFNKVNGIPLIRIRDLGKNCTEAFYKGNYDEQYLIDSGDLLIGMDGEFNIVKWQGPKSLLNQRVCKIRLHNKNIINDTYLYYSLLKPLKKIEKQIGQTTVKHLSTKDIEKIKIPLPPLDEQKKIAEILSTVDQAIKKVDEAIEKTERLKKGLMQQLLTKGIGHKEFQKTKIGLIPKAWSIKKIGDVITLCQYGLSKKITDKGKYPIIKMDDIINGSVMDENVKYVDINDKIFMQYELKKGDILFNRTNSYELVGRTGLFQLDGDYVFASYLIRIRPNYKLIDPSFLTLSLINSNDRLRQLATRAVHQANINATNLRNFRIPVPSLSEQKEITEFALIFNSRLELSKKRRSKLENIKKSLMNDLLTGKKRIKNVSD